MNVTSNPHVIARQPKTISADELAKQLHKDTGFHFYVVDGDVFVKGNFSQADIADLENKASDLLDAAK